MEDKSIQGQTEKRVVIDIGSGGAPFPLGLRQRKIGEDELYIAIEPVKEKIARAGSSLRKFYVGTGATEAVQARAEKLPFKDKSVDEIVIANLMGDFRLMSQTESALAEKGLLSSMVTEVFRVLKDDGRVLVVESFSPYPFVDKLEDIFEDDGLFMTRHIKSRDGEQAQKEIEEYIIGGLADREISYLLEFRKRI